MTSTESPEFAVAQSMNPEVGNFYHVPTEWQIASVAREIALINAGDTVNEDGSRPNYGLPDQLINAYVGPGLAPRLPGTVNAAAVMFNEAKTAFDVTINADNGEVGFKHKDEEEAIRADDAVSSARTLAEYRDSFDRSYETEGKVADHFDELLGDALIIDDKLSAYARMRIESAYSTKKGEPKPVAWENLAVNPGMYPTSDMDELLSTTQLESTVVLAAAKFAILLQQPESEREAFELAIECVEYHAPMLEILGYNEFATAMRDHVVKSALVKSGNEEYVEAAVDRRKDSETTIRRLGSIALGDEYEYVSTVDLPETQEPTGLYENVGFFVLNGDANVNEGGLPPIMVREKTPASGALKRYRRGIEEISNDELALMVVVPDEPQSINAASWLYENVQSTDDVEIIQSDRKDSTVYARKASTKHSHALKNEFDQEHNVKLEIERGQVGEFNGTKFVLEMARTEGSEDRVRAELMVLTKAEFDNYRVDANHGVKKNDALDSSDPAVVRSLQERLNSLVDQDEVVIYEEVRDAGPKLAEAIDIAVNKDSENELVSAA